MILPAVALAVAVPAVAIHQEANWAQVFTAFAAAITPLMVLVLNWLNKRQEAQWKQEDKAHKQALERAASEAALEAAKAARAVAESKRERHEQMQTLESKLDANTKISQQAFTEANGVNQKIASIGIEVARNASDKEGRRADVAIAYASGKAIALAEHANEKLDEIAENTKTQQLS